MVPKRPRKLLAINGRQMTIAAAARSLGMADNTLRTRIVRGWSDDRAIRTAVQIKEGSS